MANFNNIKNEIDQNVNTNGVQAITGAILNTTLKDMLDDVDSQKQDTLQAGSGISISGNVISATGGGSGSEYYAGTGITIDSGNVISADFNEVQEKLVDGQNIKTVGGEPILGSGDIDIPSYTAGNGINISQVGGNYEISVDASDLAGSGLEVDEFGALKTDPNLVQEKLTAGSNISISGNTISATDTTYSAGSGILIDQNNEISADTSVLQEKLTAGSGISISAQNVISATGGGSGTTFTTGDAIELDANDHLNVLYGSGLTLNGNNELEVDPFGMPFLPLAGGQLQDDPNNTNSTDLNITSPSSNAHIDVYTEDGVNPGDGTAYVEVQDPNGTAVYGSDGITINGDKLSFPTGPATLATDADLSDYLPLTGGTLQDSSDTELTVIDGNSEDYIKIVAPETAGVQPHVEIFENGSGDTKFFYDHIERGSQVSIDLPSSSGTLALTSDIPSASDLDGWGLTATQGGELEVDGSVLAGSGITWDPQNKVFNATGGGGGNYLPLDGGVLSDTTGNAATALNITPATGQVGGGTVYISSAPQVQVGSSNSANGYTNIGQNSIQLNDGNGNDLLITNTGFDDGTYTLSFPTLSQNETIATLSDIQGGGSGLWSSGTGTDSLMAPDTVSSGGTAAGVGALNAGHYDSAHPGNPSGATGDYSAVFGTGTRATGDDAFVSGEFNTASGTRSFVGGGSNNTASGRGSAVIGGDMGTAAGENSVSIAGGYAGPGNGAVAIGGTASALGSISINGTAAANTSVAIQGGHTYSGASGSVAIIGETDGQFSVALGKGTHASNENEVATGSYNKTYQSQTASTATSFTVGNGVSGTPSNALEFKQNSDAYLYGVGNYDGTNAGASGVHTLQYVINNAGGGGTSFTAGDGLELDQNDNLNVLYGSGLTLNGNNELEVDPTSITGFLPLDGGTLQGDPLIPATDTVLDIVSPLGVSNISLDSGDNADPNDPQGTATISMNDSNGYIIIKPDGISDGTYTTSWPSPSADTTFATLEDVSGFLPLVGGTLQEDPNNAASTDLVIQSPESYATAAIETVDLDPGNTSESMAKITLSDYDSSANAHEAVYTSTGISDGTYTLSFPTLSQNETIATLSDISGGGTSYTAGTGISISAQNVISNSAPDPGLWVAGTGTDAIRSRLATSATGNYSLSLGKSSTSNGTNAISLGYWSSCGGTSNVSIGSNANSAGQNCVAAGHYATANGLSAVALGHQTLTSNQNEVALGNANNSISTGTTAEKTHFTVGNGTGLQSRSNLIEAKQNDDIYVIGVGGFDGTNAGSTGVHTLQYAIANAGGGSSLWTSGTGTDSLVAPATITAGLSVDPAQGTGAISCGYDTNADGDYAFASGAGSSAGGDYGFAANNAISGGDYSAAFNTSGADGDYSFAAGYGSTAGAQSSVALAGGTTVYDDSDPYNIIDAEGSVAIGGAITNAYHSIAIGSNAQTSDVATSGIAIGTGAYSNAQEAIAIGSGSIAEGQGALALSSGTASGEYSTAMSTGMAIGTSSVAGGIGALANICSSVALGFNTMTYDQNDPTDTSDAQAGECALGRFNYTDSDFIFSVGCGYEVYHDPNDPDFEPNPDDPDSPDGWTETVRQNAITITTDGSIYIKGLGQYDGTQISGALTLQDLVGNSV